MANNEPVQFKLMLPASLKNKLEHASADNRRSLSAEIVARLEPTFDEEAKERKLAAIVNDLKRALEDQTRIIEFMREEIRHLRQG